MLGGTLAIRTLQDRFFVLHDHFSNLIALAVWVNQHSVFVQHRHAVEESDALSSNLGLDRKFRRNQFQVLHIFCAEILIFSRNIQRLLLDQVLITVVDNTVHGLIVENILNVRHLIITCGVLRTFLLVWALVQESGIPIWVLERIIGLGFVLHIEGVHEVFQVRHCLVVEEFTVSAIGEKTLEICIDLFILHWILIWFKLDKGLSESHRKLFGQVLVDRERHIRGVISHGHIAILLRSRRTGAAFDLHL